MDWWLWRVHTDRRIAVGQGHPSVDNKFPDAGSGFRASVALTSRITCRPCSYCPSSSTLTNAVIGSKQADSTPSTCSRPSSPKQNQRRSAE